MGGIADSAAWLWMGIWIVALVAMVWLVVRSTGARAEGDDALAILRARFARGEINEDEYQRARMTLLAEGKRP